MQLRYGQAAVVLSVLDDGSGFEPEMLRNIGEHYGLTGMKERAESAGGTLEIVSTPGQGTEIIAALPHG
jgi:signal transduction histidine kinase